jgi:hypothetical protein
MRILSAPVAEEGAALVTCDHSAIPLIIPLHPVIYGDHAVCIILKDRRAVLAMPRARPPKACPADRAGRLP